MQTKKLVLFFGAAFIAIAAIASPADSNAFVNSEIVVSGSESATNAETLVWALDKLSGTTAISVADVTTISGSVAEALKSGHRGLESAALRLVISYGKTIDLDDEAVLDVVRLYRDHRDENMRQMAIVAIGAANDDWAVDFLQRSERFEDSPRLRRTIHAVLQAG
ncbi:MAG: hypothetical protein ACI80V_000384 [Rhodothermales bacterium]|jgi:hypothetical protein